MGHAVRSVGHKTQTMMNLPLMKLSAPSATAMPRKNMTAEFNRIQMDQMMSAEPSKQSKSANWNPAIRETTKTRAQLWE